MFVTIIKFFKVQYQSISQKCLILKFSEKSFWNRFDSDSLKSHFFNQTKWLKIFWFIGNRLHKMYCNIEKSIRENRKDLIGEIISYYYFTLITDIKWIICSTFCFRSPQSLRLNGRGPLRSYRLYWHCVIQIESLALCDSSTYHFDLDNNFDIGRFYENVKFSK